MISNKVISVMAASVLLVSIAGCSTHHGTTSTAEPGQTSGKAMVRGSSTENYTHPGAGGMGQGGNMGTGNQMVQDKLHACSDLMTQQLSNAGNDYDQRYIDILINQKESQLRLDQDGEHNAKHPELKKWAKEMVSTDQKELDQLKSLEKQWFGNAGPTATNR